MNIKVSSVTLILLWVINMISLNHKVCSFLLFLGALLIIVAIGDFYGLVEAYTSFSSTSLSYVGVVGLLLVLLAHGFNESNYD